MFVIITLWTTLVLGLDWIPIVTAHPVPSLVPGALSVLIPLVINVLVFSLAMGLLYVGVKRESKSVVWASVACQVSMQPLSFASSSFLRSLIGS